MADGIDTDPNLAETTAGLMRINELQEARDMLATGRPMESGRYTMTEEEWAKWEKRYELASTDPAW